MPSRLVFNKKEEFLKWITRCSETQYEVYVTDYGEFILAPTKSTKSLRYAYIDTYSAWDNPTEAIKDIRRKLPRIEIYHISKFDWDATKSVTVRQVIE